MRRATVAIEDERFYKHGGVDLNAHRARRHQEPRVRQDRAGRLDDHPAARARALHQGPEAQLRAQDPRGQARLRARGQALEDLDPPQLPERGAVRHGRRPHRDRRRGRRRHLLQQARQEPRRWTSRRCSPASRRRRPSTTRSATRRPRSSAATRCSRKMVENGYITQAEATRAAQRGRSGSQHGTRYIQRREPYFFDYVQEQLIERYGVGVVPPRRPAHPHDDRPEAAGGRPRRDQRATTPTRPARARRSSRSTRPTGRSARWRRAAPTSDRNFNLAAQGHRQPGSAFKTFVLTTAIRKGVDPDTHLLHLEAAQHRRPDVRALGGQDLRQQLHRHGQPHARDAVVGQHRLRAADPRHRAEGGLRDGQAARHHHQARLLPGRGPRRPARCGVTPLEMADAYATLASGGIRHRPTGDREGRVPRRQEREPGELEGQARAHRRRGLRGDEGPAR